MNEHRSNMTRILTHKALITAAAVWAAMASCTVPYSQDNTEADFGMQESDSLATVVFRASHTAGASKVTGIMDDNECTIYRWAVFAFDEEAGGFRYECSQGESTVSMKLAMGRRYTCYAIVNYPVSGTGAFNPESIRTPEDLTGKTAYISDNRTWSLLMFGSAFVIPMPGIGDEITINVRRLVSRIDLKGLKVDFSGKPKLLGKVFTLRSIYVTNTYKTTLYGRDYSYYEISQSRAAWYNTGGWHRGESPENGIDALTGDMAINTPVSAEHPYTEKHSFYAFPNPTALQDDVRTMDAWTKRCTRLVIEASIGEDIFYYAINVPSMGRNRIYAASNVIIRGKGSKDPEIMDIEPDVIEVTVAPVIDDAWDGLGDIYLD